jgi:sulfide:quinone oxidoreductase
MLHDYLVQRGVRDKCQISLFLPLSSPVPPSPETSKALLAAFAERGITFHPNRKIASIDAKKRIATLEGGGEVAFDLFLGVPKHHTPRVVRESGLAEDGWIAVDPRTLQTRFPHVYAVGDGANTGTPKAGVFAEGAAKAVASALIAAMKGGDAKPYDGFGTCYIEFGAGRIGKVEVDFFSGSQPRGSYYEPSEALRADKNEFGASRRARWFGM